MESKCNTIYMQQIYTCIYFTGTDKAYFWRIFLFFFSVIGRKIVYFSKHFELLFVHNTTCQVTMRTKSLCFPFKFLHFKYFSWSIMLHTGKMVQLMVSMQNSCFSCGLFQHNFTLMSKRAAIRSNFLNELYAYLMSTC